VRLLTKKEISESMRSGAGAGDIIKTIAGLEKKYQEELNRAFGALSEGAFKSLRRQLPVTRQKINWDKIMTYRVSSVLLYDLRVLCLILTNWGGYSWDKILVVGEAREGSNELVLYQVTLALEVEVCIMTMILIQF